MRPLTDKAATRRLLDRLQFGPAPGDRPYPDVMTLLLSPVAAPGDPPALDGAPGVNSMDPQVKISAEKALSQDNAMLASWWLDRMVTSDQPFVEKLTWFWHGHFATGASTVRSARLMLAQNQTLRQLGAGRFDDLVAAMVVDPAMLVWLNGNENRVGAPNENLARELMELFTLGVGHYSETDVREAARALTGWTVDKPSITAKLDPKRHDPRPKTVLGAEVSDSASLVSVLVTRPESARFVVSRVWFRFVSPDPPPPDVLARLVAVYGASRDIGALMRAVANEPAFLDPKNVLVKQPVEWAVGLMRALAVQPSAFRRRTPTGCAGRCGRSGRCRSTRQASAVGPPARCG